MKHISIKSFKEEKGMALILVLCLLAVGGLTIATLLNFTVAGMRAGKNYDEEIRLQYAADAGMEEAIWRMKNDQLPFVPGTYNESANYTLEDNLNGNQTSINITYIWPLAGIESDAYGIDPPDSLAITGGIINQSEGKYKVQISYDGTKGDLPVDKISVWLPSRFEHVEGSCSGITEEDPVTTYERGGKVLSWIFDPAVNFMDLPNPSEGGGGFTPGAEYPASRKLYFNLTPLHDQAGGSFAWVRSTDTDMYLAWETGLNLYQIESTSTNNTTGEQYTLTTQTYYSEGSSFGEGVFQTRGGYRAIGNTLMVDNDENHNIRETLLESSSANITGLPPDSEVVLAYLYWSAWREFEGTMEADTEVNFRINGQGVNFDEYGVAVNGTGNISASRYWLLENQNNDYSYSCFKDVTDLVRLNDPQGNAEYTVANVTGNTTDYWSFAGWSLILFYSSPSEQSQQMFLYDHFFWAQAYQTHTFTIEGFVSPENADVTLTCFVGEGDEAIGSNSPYYSYPRDYIKFNGTYLSDAMNPKYNVWNGKSSGLGGLVVDGVDIDSFDVSSPLIESGDTSAIIELGTTMDNFNLIYLVLSFSSNSSGLIPNTIGIISYSGGS